MADEWMTLREVADALGYRRTSSVRKKLKDHLRFFRPYPGARWRVRREDVERMLSQESAAPEAPRAPGAL